MSAEEIDQLVADTAALASGSMEDASELVAQLQAVTVDNLPEEIRTYDYTDVTDASGIRRIDVTADVDGIGQTYILLDAAAIPPGGHPLAEPVPQPDWLAGHHGAFFGGCLRASESLPLRRRGEAGRAEHGRRAGLPPLHPRQLEGDGRRYGCQLRAAQRAAFRERVHRHGADCLQHRAVPPDDEAVL